MKYTKKQLKENIKTSLTDILNQYVEETSFDEEEILEVIKEVAKEMEYI
jgi:hypothetical protein